MFYPSGLLMDRRGRRIVAVSCLAGLGLGLALVPLTGAPGWFTAVALVVGLGNGFGSGIVMTLGADYSPSRARPQFLALWRLQSDTGLLAGPAILSAVTALAGLAAGIWVIAVIAGIGAVVFARSLPRGTGPVA
jgi:MFS family permease